MSYKIKFLAFCVKNTETGKTARVHYSLDNRTDGRKCVTVYARDYGHAIGEIFNGVASYKNDTDSMTDYFDKGTVRIFETDGIYTEARAAVELILAKEEIKRDARWAARRARADARGAVAR